MAQLGGKLLDVEDSPDAHVKLTPVDYPLAIGNGFEPPDEEDGLATPTYASKNDENDETNRSKQQTFEVQDPEDYIIVEDEDSGLNYVRTEIVPDEVLKAFLGLDTFGTRDIFKKEFKDSQAPEPAGTDQTPSGSNLSERDNGTVDRSPSPYAASREQDFPESTNPACASVNGVIQFFDSIHALSIVAQDLEGEDSLKSTSVHVGPAKNIEKQEKRSVGIGLVYSHPSTGPDDLITTMEPPKNDDHKADNVNSETTPPGSSPISDELTGKDDENVHLRDNAQEPEYAPQQESSEIAQGQDENVYLRDNAWEPDYAPQQESSEIAQGLDENVHLRDNAQEPDYAPHQESSEIAQGQDENVHLRDNAQEPDCAPQQESSDIAQGQEEDFTGQPANDADDFASPVPQKGIMQAPPNVKQTIETPIEEDPVFATIRESFYDVAAPDKMLRSDVNQEDESGRSDSDDVRSGPCPDNSVIAEETMNPVEEKPNTEEGRGDKGAEIARRKQEELQAGEDEKKQKSYDHQKSYTEKIYETASGAAQAVASKLGYGAAEDRSEETDGFNEGNNKGKKGIVERAGGVVASMLGIKHPKEDSQQQESPRDMQEQKQAEAENVETVEPQFWDAQAENVETVEEQAENVETDEEQTQ